MPAFINSMHGGDLLKSNFLEHATLSRARLSLKNNNYLEIYNQFNAGTWYQFNDEGQETRINWKSIKKKCKMQRILIFSNVTISELVTINF